MKSSINWEGKAGRQGKLILRPDWVQLMFGMMCGSHPACMRLPHPARCGLHLLHSGSLPDHGPCS